MQTPRVTVPNTTDPIRLPTLGSSTTLWEDRFIFRAVSGDDGIVSRLNHLDKNPTARAVGRQSSAQAGKKLQTIVPELLPDVCRGVRVWLDAAGRLLVNKDAPAEWKHLVREHKQELIQGLGEPSASRSSALQTDIPICATSWAEWKAEALNRLFQEQGRAGQRGRITTETVRRGARNPPAPAKS